MKKLLLAWALTAGFAANALAADTQYNLRVDGMTCSLCAMKVSHALKKIDGVDSVDVDVDNGLVKTCVKEGVTLNDKQISDVLLAKGYTYRGMEKHGRCSL